MLNRKPHKVFARSRRQCGAVADGVTSALRECMTPPDSAMTSVELLDSKHQQAFSVQDTPSASSHHHCSGSAGGGVQSSNDARGGRIDHHHASSSSSSSSSAQHEAPAGVMSSRFSTAKTLFHLQNRTKHAAH
jgi:hypothetical protein